MVSSIPQDYFVKCSSSEVANIGATDRNRTWGICYHHDCILLWLLLCFRGDYYPHEGYQTKELFRESCLRLLCWDLGRFLASWEWGILQDWAHRVHQSYLWGYFWLNISSVGNPEVQGGYVFHQWNLCVWHGCRATRRYHQMSLLYKRLHVNTATLLIQIGGSRLPTRRIINTKLSFQRYTLWQFISRSTSLWIKLTSRASTMEMVVAI